MANMSPFLQLTLVLGFGTLVSKIEAKRFKNSYLQNVQSGQCLQFDADENGKHLFASKCNCGLYQFWKMEDEEHVINEFSVHPYMDEYAGNQANGAYVGNYDYTGSNWQKWRLNEDDTDSNKFTLVNKHTSKCLHQGYSGYIDQWECDDDDPKQQWKVIENPCGKLPKFPSGRFQLQNPETGLCAVILKNSNAGWAAVGTHECSCDNKYHYWKFWNNLREVIVSDGSSQCIANWEADGYPGVTQCTCDSAVRHRWGFVPLDDDGNFQLKTAVCQKCVYVEDGTHQDSQIRFVDCDRNDALQKWRFYDACHPTPKPTPPPPTPPPTPPPQLNVIPIYLVYFFDNGQMNWLNPTRYTLLVGGHWDPVALVWITVDGRQIKPDTDTWSLYFGDVTPTFLNVLFPGGKSWKDVFGWMTLDFFQTWTAWKPVPPKPTPPPQPPNVIPNYLVTFFNNGQMNWLTPERYTLLLGGHWDPTALVWYTIDGRQIRPSNQEWTIYFGDLQPSQLTVMFPSGESWNDVFGWMTPAFFQTWTGWQEVQVPFNIPIVISGNIPPGTSQLFASGRVNWLTPDRIKMLAGGKWTGSEFVTKAQVHVVPGTQTWTTYFGSANPADVNTLFGGSGQWDATFAWLTDAVRSVPAGMTPGGTFPWNSFFGQTLG